MRVSIPLDPLPDGRVPMGHNLCKCGKFKHKSAAHCWKCEHKDEEVFAELDRRIEAEAQRRESKISQPIGEG